MENIYDDLENFDFSEEVEKLRNENSTLSDQISELQNINKTLSEKYAILEKENKELRTNISSLHKTSTAEIQRKDKTITDLREKVDTIIFKRESSNNKKQYNVLPFPPKSSHIPVISEPTKSCFDNSSHERHFPQTKSLTSSNPISNNDRRVALDAPKQWPSRTNEESKNSDSQQNTFKVEADQTSSQSAFERIEERRLKLIQQEFERDYLEAENMFQSKGFENKQTLKSPLRSQPSSRNKRLIQPEFERDCLVAENMLHSKGFENKQTLKSPLRSQPSSRSRRLIQPEVERDYLEAENLFQNKGFENTQPLKSPLRNQPSSRSRRLIHPEFERDYLETENMLQSKGFENKQPLKSPLRCQPSSKSRRLSPDRFDDHRREPKRLRSRSNDRNRNCKRSRSPRRRSRSRGVPNRSNSGDRKKIRRDESAVKFDQRDKYFREEERRYFSDKFDKPSSERKDNLYHHSKRPSKDHRRESNSIGDQRVLKYRNETEKRHSSPLQDRNKIFNEHKIDKRSKSPAALNPIKLQKRTSISQENSSSISKENNPNNKNFMDDFQNIEVKMEKTISNSEVMTCQIIKPEPLDDKEEGKIEDKMDKRSKNLVALNPNKLQKRTSTSQENGSSIYKENNLNKKNVMVDFQNTEVKIEETLSNPEVVTCQIIKPEPLDDKEEGEIEDDSCEFDCKASTARIANATTFDIKSEIKNSPEHFFGASEILAPLKADNSISPFSKNVSEISNTKIYKRNHRLVHYSFTETLKGNSTTLTKVDQVTIENTKTIPENNKIVPSPIETKCSKDLQKSILDNLCPEKDLQTKIRISDKYQRKSASKSDINNVQPCSFMQVQNPNKKCSSIDKNKCEKGSSEKIHSSKHEDESYSNKPTSKPHEDMKFSSDKPGNQVDNFVCSLGKQKDLTEENSIVMKNKVHKVILENEPAFQSNYSSQSDSMCQADLQKNTLNSDKKIKPKRVLSEAQENSCLKGNGELEKRFEKALLAKESKPVLPNLDDCITQHNPENNCTGIRNKLEKSELHYKINETESKPKKCLTEVKNLATKSTSESVSLKSKRITEKGDICETNLSLQKPVKFESKDDKGNSIFNIDRKSEKMDPSLPVDNPEKSTIESDSYLFRNNLLTTNHIRSPRPKEKEGSNIIEFSNKPEQKSLITPQVKQEITAQNKSSISVSLPKHETLKSKTSDSKSETVEIGSKYSLNSLNNKLKLKENSSESRKQPEKEHSNSNIDVSSETLKTSTGKSVTDVSAPKHPSFKANFKIPKKKSEVSDLECNSTGQKKKPVDLENESRQSDLECNFTEHKEKPIDLENDLKKSDLECNSTGHKKKSDDLTNESRKSDLECNSTGQKKMPIELENKPRTSDTSVSETSVSIKSPQSVTNAPKEISNECQVSPNNDNTLHIKIFRRKTLVKKL